MSDSTHHELSALLSKFGLCIWKIDLKTYRFEYLSNGIAKLYGIPKSQLLKNPDLWLTMVVADDRKRVEIASAKLLELPSEVDLTYRIVKPNGKTRWMRDLKRSYTDETGAVAYIEGLIEDVTDSVLAELKNMVNEKRYKLYFQNNPKPMWVYDCETLQFSEVNKAAIRQYGYAREEFLKMKITEIRPPEDIPRLLHSVRQLKAGMHHSRAWTHRNKNGDSFKVEISGYVFHDATGKKELVVINDISNLVSFSEKIEAFAHITSHEVRKPLANILALVDLMHMEADQVQKEMLCNKLADSAHELDDLLKAAAATIRKQSLKNSLLESLFSKDIGNTPT